MFSLLPPCRNVIADELRPLCSQTVLFARRKIEVTQKAEPKISQGRPRDPNLEEKVFHTTMLLYSSGGWQYLTFDRVSKEAGVGKAAIYRRWADRGELLSDALDAKWFEVSNIDTGTLKGDLQALAQMLFNKLTGTYGHTSFFLQADSRKFPEVRKATVHYRSRLIREAMTIVHRGVSRDQLPLYINPNLVMDVIVGAISNHIATTPPEKMDLMIADAPQYIDQLVAMVLAGQSK